MPSFHPKFPSTPRRRTQSTASAIAPAQSPPSSPSPNHPNASPEMQLKGVKRIVSGLKRRISHISFHGHGHGRRGSSGSDSSLDAPRPPSPPLFLDIVPADVPHPITFPASPRVDSSVDTLTRSVSAGGLGKHPSDSEDSSESSAHSRDSSLDSSGSYSFHDARAESQPASSPPHPGSSSPSAAAEEDRRSDLHARLPPVESLTAPLEALVLPLDEPLPSPSSERTRNISLASLESLTAPLEVLVLPSDEPLPPPSERTRAFSLASVESLTAPIESLVLPDHTITPPQPKLEPCEVPLPSDFEPWEIPLPDDDEFDSIPTPDSPHIIPMDPLGVSVPQAEAAPPAVDVEVVAEGGAPASDDAPLTSTLDSQLSASMEVPRELPLVSPPAPVGQPEVPDPFLKDADIEASEDTSESEGEDASSGSSGALEPAAAEEIALAPSSPAPPAPDVNKAVPPTPTTAAALPSDDEEDEEDVPELYLPGLTLPTMFLPIPNVRYPLFSSLTWWLSKSMINYATRRPLYR